MYCILNVIGRQAENYWKMRLENLVAQINRIAKLIALKLAYGLNSFSGCTCNCKERGAGDKKSLCPQKQMKV